jgi:hypothetical protein
MSVLLSPRLLTTTESRFDADWSRQRHTALDILQRLKTQEGVILADQVGMGKTYVALAVAVSQILSTDEPGQVVIFVPAAVADKWVREWRKFSETLLAPGTGIRCVDQPVRSGEALLKQLDDAPETRAHVVVVTHTALTAMLKDTFIQLALLHYATRYQRDGADLRKRIAKWSTGLDGLFRDREFTTRRVEKLLDTHPSKWRDMWTRLGGAALSDDPVPAALEDTVRNLDLGALRAVIDALPIRSSESIRDRLENARKALANITQSTWKSLLSRTELDLPLLIVDEAHRLKNPNAKLGKLFGERSDAADSGAFRGIFRRMLFLTATPFELGHSELIEVLSRMGAVRAADLPPVPPLKDRLEQLRKVLTAAQSGALRFDTAWGRIAHHELSEFDGWEPESCAPTGISVAVREAWEHARLAVESRKQMHDALKPWIIRHERPQRRSYHAGAAIVPNGDSTSGLPIPDNVAFPFLLAARAQSVALDESAVRPLFAYGIASSYEAFLRLGSSAADAVLDSDLQKDDREDEVALVAQQCTASNAIAWYRKEIDAALASDAIRDAHPKVRATVEKAAQLWLDGEKCLIFCWFIKTGEAVERALTRCVDRLILQRAAEGLGTGSDEATRAELERLSDRLFRRDGASYERIRSLLETALAQAADHHADVVDLVVDAVIRHLRTDSYLVRYTRLHREMTDEDVWAGINGSNPGRIVVLDRWKGFAERLARARNQVETVNSNEQRDSEFARIRQALLGADADDEQSAGRGAKLSPVRRAHGQSKRETRERLIALFNTPLSPDLLVASSVMGEGIDLHQECRFVIHHDLDWNPSVLEQRTGRLDRIGALAERAGKQIEVYEPYLAGTHDEKMFRVVKDRAQWFDVVMGRPSNADEHHTDAEEKRVPLHERIHKALLMDLRSPRSGS